MKFDPGKAWPYPVLRPASYGDDYPEAEFEVEIDLQRVKGSTAVDVLAEFQLSDPDLLQLVEQGKARFVLLVKAPKTHCREFFESDQPNIRHSFSAGELSGRIEFASFLVCAQALQGFKADGWHTDFAGRTFDIPAGAVLAVDEPKEYWIDTAEEAPLGSIFGHKSQAGIPDGRWDLEFAPDHVYILMSEIDAAQFEAARNQANNQPDGQYLMNGLYLPVLLAVLNKVDRNVEDYQDYRWYTSLDQRLSSLGCPPLGKSTADRWIDAQKVLDSPFLKMPMIAEALTDNS